MAATTSFAAAVPSASSSLTKTLKSDSTNLSPNLGFLSSKAFQSLRARVLPASSVGGTGSALAARMVSTPLIKPPALLDFETSVFKKEKVSLAGHDEVFYPLFFPCGFLHGSRENGREILHFLSIFVRLP